MENTIPYNDSFAACLQKAYVEAGGLELYDDWNTVYLDGDKYTLWSDLDQSTKDSFEKDFDKFFDLNLYDVLAYDETDQTEFRWCVYPLEMSRGVASKDIKPHVQTNTCNVLLSGTFDPYGIPTED